MGKFTAEQKPLMDKSLDKAAEAAMEFVSKKFQDIMNTYNRNDL